MQQSNHQPTTTGTSYQSNLQPQQKQQQIQSVVEVKPQQQQWSPSDSYPSDSNVSEEFLSMSQRCQDDGNTQCPSFQSNTHFNNSNSSSSASTYMMMNQYQHEQRLSTTLECVGCGMKQAIKGSNCCSRRCRWVMNCQCPQCGKGKPEGFTYCSRSCGYQSSRANWCSICGVCQTNPMSGFCANYHCIGGQGEGSSHSNTPPPESGLRPVVLGMDGQPLLPSINQNQNYQQQQVAPSLVPSSLSMSNSFRNNRHAASRMECRVMNSSEMNSSGIPNLFSAMWSSGLGVRIVSAMKLTTSATQRKRYLSYRSIVENQMASQGIPKYGHGGEGNEQRRYFGIPLQCALGYETTPSRSSSSNSGGGDNLPYAENNGGHHQERISVPSLRTCYDPDCVACCVVTRGFDLQALGLSSHYCNTTSTAAAQFLKPSPISGLKALVVARVVVGNPQVHVVNAATEPPFIQAPQDPATHSMVLTNNDHHYDGTYVFTDEAVDPQYLVLFE